MMGAVMQRPAPPGRFAVLTAVSVAMLVVCAVWAVGEARVVEGQAAWAKPAKFALSFVVFFATLAWVDERLSAASRESRLMRVVVTVMAVSMLGEMVYMTGMAAQGQGSHYNESTTFHFVMYNLMGLGAFLLVLGVAIMGVVVLRDTGARFGPAMRAAVGWGFVLTFVLTLVTAFTMGAIGRHVGVHPEGGAVIPLFGWSAVVGDLRPAHFLALHAMQAVPIAALVWDRRGVKVFCAVWAGVTMAVYAQAMMGMPLVTW
jgi:hypothetical protein